MSVAPASIRVEGLDKLRRALKSLGPQATRELRDGLKGVAIEVASAAQANVPVVTGAARNSIRGGTQGSYAIVRAGGSSAPYYGWLDFGGLLRPTGRRRNSIPRARIKGGRYIYPAVARRHADIARAAQAAITRAARNVGL